MTRIKATQVRGEDRAELSSALFHGLTNVTLVAIVRREINVLDLARKELANRRLDRQGTWVGTTKGARHDG